MNVPQFFGIRADETTTGALRRLGFERVDCDCSRCSSVATARFERRKIVRVADGALAMPCRTSVETCNEWIRSGCPIPSRGAA